MKTIRIFALLFACVGLARAAAPSIDTQPAPATNCVGTSASFTVAASGDPVLSYQWYFNETNLIANATNTSVAISSVSVGSAGGYSVVVTNDSGSSTSSVVTLTVNPQPTLSVNSATICAGSSAMLTATTDAATPGYLWSPGGATTASITVSPGATTIYTLVVTDGVTGCTNTASGTVTVNPQPTVSVNSAAVCTNTAGVLTATTSAANPTYLWSPGGQTTASVTNTPTTTTTYTVLVTSGVTGCTNSASGTVTVNPRPTVSVNSVTVCTNTAGVLTATTSAANPTYLWSPGGQTTASVTNTPTTTTTYTVLVTSGVTGCTNSASGTITVIAQTTATAFVNQTNCPGSSATFTTVASGAGPFTYQWTSNGVDVAGATLASYTIPGITSASAATYCVRVTGACNIVTNCATLTVATLPVLAVQPANQITPMGNGAVFSVTATTINTVIAPLSYQWQTNSVNVPGATASTFAISNLTLAANGMLVRVLVTDCVGTVTSTAATLTVTPIHGLSFDFNTPGQYTNAPYNMANSDWMNNQLVNNQPFGPVVPFEVSTGGVGVATGGGALDLMFNNGTDQTSTLLPATYDFSLPGKTLTASIMTKIKFPTANQRAIHIGFINTTNINNAVQGINANNGLGFMTVIFQSTLQPSLSYMLRAQYKTIAGTTAIETQPINTPTNQLATNNWYKLVAKFVNVKAAGNSSSNYTVESYLQDMGPTGLTPGSIVLAYAPLLQTNVDLVNSANLLFAIRGFENGGQDYWDNIYVTAASGNLAFVDQPASQSVPQGRTASFRARVDGDGPYTYQWFKNGSPIAGAGNWRYRTPPLLTSDNGALFTVSVTSTNNTITSIPAAVTVTGDALDLVSVGSVEGSVIGARFDQPVDKVTAETAANYLINGVAAYAASLRANGVDVLLTPAAPLTGNFTVVAANVQSISGTLIGANNTAVGYVAGLTGFDINPLSETPGFYQNNAPSISTFIGDNYSFASNSFEITGGGHDIFGNFDSFRYVYTQKTGDFDVKVRIPALDVLRTPTKAGFVVRRSLDPYSPSIYAGVNPQLPGRNFFEGTARSDFTTATISWGANTPCTYPNTWLRFRRVGNTFIRYSSTNGVNWNNDGQTSPNPAFPNTLHFGFGVCANVGGGVLQQGVRAQLDNYGDFIGYPGAVITITQQPANITIAAGSNASFTNFATVTVAPAGGELTYVWQRTNALGGWTNLIAAGVTNAVLDIGPFYFSDNGAKFRAIVRVPGALSVTSSVVTLTVTDVTAATVQAGFTPTNSLNQILVRFSENMSSASALNPANYQVTNAAGTVFGIASVALLNGDARTVIITTTSVLPAGDYGVRVTGVLDLNGNATTTVSIFNQAGVAPVYPVVIDYYGSLASTSTLTDLTNNAKFLANTPDWIVYSNAPNVNGYNTTFPTSFFGDNYGVKMYSYFIAPSNAQYVFWYRADDFARFFMCTNGSQTATTNPANRAYANSMTINNASYQVTNTMITPLLVAGQTYYMELNYKETGVGDGGAIMVTMTTNTATIPAATEVAPARLFRFPDAVAPRPVAVVELYTGLAQISVLGNGNIQDLIISTNSIPFISKQPNAILYEKYFGYSTNLGNTSLDGYLGRIYSYFVPPTNGNYKFYIRSDDSSQLLMNTNAANSTDPAGVVLLGQLSVYTPAYTLAGQNITLVGGQRYYMEGRWREGAGGDGLTVAVRAQSDGAVPSVQEVILPDMLEFPTNLLRVGPINFANAGSGRGVLPFNPTINEGQTVTFIANGISGSTPYLGGMWFKNGTNVFNNSSYLVTQPLTMADNGAVYTLTISNLFSVASVSSTVTVVADMTSPFILSATASQYGDSVMVTFSETVDPLTASCLANYRIGGLAIYSLTYDVVNRNRVLLRTSPQPLNTTYTLTVNGVRDAALAGNIIAPNSTMNFSSWGYGGFGGTYVELFTNIAGSLVANLQNDPKFVNNLPDVSYYTNNFGVGLFGAQSGLEFYGARISAFFMPPSNGLYQFYIRSDDGSQLFMNTNGPTTAERVMIARNDGANPVAVGTIASAYQAGTGLGRVGANMSPILSLTNGTAYYLEGLLKEGGGGDYMQVVMRSIDPGTGLPYVALPAVAVVGENLTGGFFKAPGDPNVNRLNISSAPPAVLTTNENAFISLSLVASVLPPSATPFVTYQWQRSNDLSGFVNVPGATTPAYSFYLPLSDEGATYRLLVGLPATNVTFTTLIHVIQDFEPPYLVSVSSLNGTTIGLRYNEPVLSTYADEPGNYTINGGSGPQVANGGATIRTSDPSTVLLTLDAAIVGNFTVEAYSIADRAVSFNQADSTAAGSVQNLTAKDIYLTLGNVAGGFSLSPPSSSWTDTNGGFDVSANGYDVWNTADGFHFTSRQVTGNFDIKTRIQKLTGADQWSKAGLMARGSTNANSRMMFMCATPQTTPIVNQAANNFFAAQYRDTDGGAPGNVQNTNAPGYPNAAVRLQRSNSVFIGYWSTNGTEGPWTVLFTRDSAASPGGAFPDTLEVGLATTSHDQTRVLANNAFVEYRNLYFPLAATITVQPGPSLIVTGLHQSVTFSGVTAAGVGVRLQWRKDGAAILDATNSSFTIGNTLMSDSGLYTVLAYNDGGGQISSALQLIVTNALPAVVGDTLTTTQNLSLTFAATNLLGNDSDLEGDALSLLWVSGVAPVTYLANFNDGLPPVGATIYNNAGLGAAVQPTGGTGNSGYLLLNPNAGGAGGSMVINELTPGKRVSAFTANFSLKIFPASAEPADGFSISFGNDIADGPLSTYAAENGATATGFALCVDNYRFAPLAVGAAANAPGGGTANTSGIKINYKNVIIAGVQIPAAWNTDRWVPVSISVTESGACTVLIDGTNVFGNLILPNYTAIKGRFGLFSRTGGATMASSVDDISINVRTLDTALVSSFNSGGSLYGSADVNSGSLHLTDALNGQAGGFVLNDLTPLMPVTSFNASFKLRIGNGTGNAADGMSFNFANDLPNASGPVSGAAEEGAGTGLTIGIDNFPTAGPDSPSFKLKYGGVLIVPPILMPKWSSTTFIPVTVSLAAGGALTVTVDGTNVVTSLATAYTPTAGRFGFYARTGGENETHWVDDLSINVTTAGSPGSYANDFNTSFGPGTVTLTNGVITYTPPPNGCGADTFYYLASDGQVGGTSLGTVTINIIPTNAPAIVACVANQNLAAGAACTATLPDLRAQLVVSGCASVVTQNPAPGTLLGLGNVTVTFNVTNSGGFSTSCQATVTVIDSTAPSVTCPAPIIAEATSPSGAVVSFVPSGSDNCSLASLVAAPASGSTFPIGVTTVTVTATDGSGNTNACTFTVTVRDTTAPTPLCPAPIVAEAASAAGRVVNYSISATDAVDPSPTVTGSPASGSLFPIGATLVTVTTYDASRNTNICTFTVTVRDSTAPSVACSTNITQDATNSAGNVVNFSVSATDAVDPNPSVSASPASGSVFPIGITTVTVTAHDAALNTNTCTFIVTVRDTIAPVVTCSSNRVVEATNTSGNIVTFIVSATDNVDPNPTVSASPASGSVFPLGVTIVTVTAYDAALNTNTCTFTVTVRDTTAPAVTCSTNITVEATNPAGNVVNFTVSATDSVDPSPTVSASPASGSVFPLGITIVTVTAYDTALNTNTCTFTVTVHDTTAPAIDCPTNRTVVCSGTNGAQVAFTLSATDVVDASPTVTASPASGSYFSLGTNTVTVTASDASGNTNTCTFQIVVQDNTAADLTIDQSGSDVIIRWPLTCTTYVLEKTSDLTPPSSWSTVSAPVTVVDGKFQVTVPASTDAKFYRLRN